MHAPDKESSQVNHNKNKSTSLHEDLKIIQKRVLFNTVKNPNKHAQRRKCFHINETKKQACGSIYVIISHE